MGGLFGVGRGVCHGVRRCFCFCFVRGGGRSDGGATFGGVVLVLLVVSVVRGGGRRKGGGGAGQQAMRPPGGGYMPPPGAPYPPAQPDMGPPPGYNGGAPPPMANMPTRGVIAGAAGVFTVTAGLEMRVGRDGATCQILLTEPRVSGTHATLKFEGGQLYVRDENSNNGTLVGGNRIPPGAWTAVPGNVPLAFGPVEFMIRLE